MRNENNLTLSEAENLLGEIIDESLFDGGTMLCFEEYGERKDLGKVSREHAEKVFKLLQGGEKTEFLHASCIEETFRKAYPLLLIKAERVMEDGGAYLQKISQLQEFIMQNPYKDEWEKKAAAYHQVMESVGISLPSESFQNLTKISDMLLDALTFFEKKQYKNSPSIYKIRSGERAKSSPVFVPYICKYNSEKEFADVLESAPQEALFVFGGVEKTYGQVTDSFHDFYYGFAEERKRNIMKHDQLSEEEYARTADPYTRCVYLGVKSGKTIWLMPMPYERETYGNLYDDESSKFSYGKRAGYAPYEIFYKVVPAALSGTTFLARRQSGYHLNELMDEQQKIWLPTFLQEAMNKFFGEEEPMSEAWYFPEEITVGYSDGQKAEITRTSASLTLPHFHFFIPEPKDLFLDNARLRQLMRYFSVSSKDIVNLPLLPIQTLTEKILKERIQERIEKAYLKILADRIAEFLLPIEELHQELREFVEENADRVIQDAVLGKFEGFLYEKIEGAPVLNDKGEQVMTHRRKSRWSKEEVPLLEHITSDEYSDYRRKYRRSFDSVFLWAGVEAQKPTVIWKIHPRSTKDYAVLLGKQKEELPEILRLYDDLISFEKNYEHILPSNITSHYLGRGDEQRSIHVPPLCNVNICMTKRTLKSFREKEAKSM